RAALRRDRLDRGEERLRLQHHPRTPATRRVVDDVMPIGREPPEIVHTNVEDPRRDRPPDDPFREAGMDHRWKDRDYVDPQPGGFPPPLPLTRSLARRFPRALRTRASFAIAHSDHHASARSAR